MGIDTLGYHEIKEEQTTNVYASLKMMPNGEFPHTPPVIFVWSYRDQMFRRGLHVSRRGALMLANLPPSSVGSRPALLVPLVPSVCSHRPCMIEVSA